MESHYTPDLSVGHLFSRAWDVFRRHMGFMVAVFVIYALLTGSGSIFGDSWFGDLGNIIMLVIAGPITAGTYALSLGLIRGRDPDLGEIFSGFQEFGRAFGVYVVNLILVVVGFIFLIIPGIYIAAALAPCMYLVMDDKLGVADTLRKAWDMTHGYRLQIFIVGLAIIGVNILGLIAFVVGILFTGGLSLLLGAALYDELDRAYAVEAVEITQSA